MVETEPEELVELVNELQQKLKRKNKHLNVARERLGRAKDNVEKLRGIVAYQRERILELYKGQVPATRSVINEAE